MILLLLAQLLIPDPVQTPGLIRNLTKAQICATAWGRDQRHVTQKMRREVFRRQGIPWERRGEYEVDHLIPRSMGGADDLRNTWAQPGPGNRRGTQAHMKDLLELRMDRLVCDGRVALVDAQKMFREDWRAGYYWYIERGAQ